MYKTRRNVNRIGYVLRKNCRLKHITERNIEVTRRRGGRRKQLLDYLTEKRRYWKSKVGALDSTIWRTRFGRGSGPVVIQTTQ
jgi:hypothetical protein